NVLESAPLGGGGARPGTDPSLFHGVGRGGAVCGGPLLRAGPHRGVAGEEVEEHGGGHDRHLPDQRVVAASVGLQFPDHTVGGGGWRAYSLVPGAAPRTPAVATLGSGNTTTVHPVSASRSVQCPTRTPGIAVIVSFIPDTSGEPWGRSSRRSRKRPCRARRPIRRPSPLRFPAAR